MSVLVRTIRPCALLLAAGVLAALAPRAALAETPTETRADFQMVDTETWMHLGRVHVQPTLAFKNIGVDSNVFLTAVDPQSDFTATISPAALAAFHFGDRGFLLLRGQADYVWYKDFSVLTHLDFLGGARGVVKLQSLRFFGAAQYLRISERPSNEIDQRALRTERMLAGGVGYDISSRTSIDYVYKRNHVTYEDADYAAQPTCMTRIADLSYYLYSFCPYYTLGDQLDRVDTANTLRINHEMFGRTLVFAETERRNHDFTYPIPPPTALGIPPVIGSERDTSETRYLVGMELASGRLLTGFVKAGTTDIQPVYLTHQQTTALIYAASLNWQLGNRIDAKTTFDRDFYFSIYGRNLYYEQTHAGLECIVYLNRFLGVQGGLDRFELLYPVVDEKLPPLFDAPRLDVLRKIMGGIRLRITERTVATVMVGRRTRTSNLPGAYDNQVVISTGVETAF